MKNSLVSIAIFLFCWGNSYAQTYSLGNNTIILKQGRYRDSLIINESVSIRIQQRETKKLLLKSYICLCDWEPFEKSLIGSPDSFMKRFDEGFKDSHCVSYRRKQWVDRKCWKVVRMEAREVPPLPVWVSTSIH